MRPIISRHRYLSDKFSYVLFLAVLLLVAGCSSKRKISNVGVRDPRSVISENRGEEVKASEISDLRKRALNASATGGCDANLTKYLNKLSLTHIPEPKCPEGYNTRVSEAMRDQELTSEESLLFESLRKVECNGRVLISKADSLRSIADSVGIYLNQNSNFARRTPIKLNPVESEVREPSSELERKRIQRKLQEEREAQEAALRAKRRAVTLRDKLLDDLRQINDRNISIQRRIALSGSYVLTEDNLQFILNLIGNRCRIGSIQNYFARDNASLMAMEHTESLIVDPSLKHEFAMLRTMVQSILDNYIESFF